MKTTLGIALAAVAALLCGCTPQSRQEYSQAGNATAQAIKTDADAAARATKAASKAASESLSKSAGTVSASSSNPQAKPGGSTSQPSGKRSVSATNGLGGSLETGKVKSALRTASGLDTSHIDVETVGKKVILKGSVRTAQQKHQAELIAKGICGQEYQLVNQLTVAST